MPAPRCRPFTLLDGMALIAATAVGLWIGLSMQAEPIDPFGWPHVFPPNFSGGVFQWKTYRELHGFFYQLAVESCHSHFPGRSLSSAFSCDNLGRPDGDWYINPVSPRPPW